MIHVHCRTCQWVADTPSCRFSHFCYTSDAKAAFGAFPQIGRFHFLDGQFQNTIPPLLFAAISQEKYETVNHALLAMFEFIHRISDLQLPDHTLHLYYDEHAGAMRTLYALNPHATGHLCLQHWTANADRQAPLGTRRWSSR